MRFVRVADGASTRLGIASSDGAVRLLGGGQASAHGREVASYVEFCTRARRDGVAVSDLAARWVADAPELPWHLDDLDGRSGRPALAMPYVPPEVWGAAFTYRRAGQPQPERAGWARPVIFFKAMPNRCVGPREAVGSRKDATAMIPEPELGAILAASGEVLGYTIVNDVSSRDLPRENPFYMSYSKTFTRCASLGPAIAPPEAIPDTRNLRVTCRVVRAGSTLWEEEGSTRMLSWEIDDLVRHLLAHNEVPEGTLLATGTVLSPPADMHLVEGDVVQISVEGLGLLENPVIWV